MAIEEIKRKLFVSYSWTDQKHMDWVIQLATDLRTNGIDTVLDKWHLREGQDAHAFMEQMVTDADVNKVIIISDRKYAERADQRVGGVGAESQIMSSELYGKVDQTKFVAICRENDENDRAILPAFLRSRIYIDFVNDDLYEDRLEQLLRWCYDKPLYIEPEIGQPPAFSDNNISPVIRRQAEFSRITRTQPDGSGSVSAVVEFFRNISTDEALPFSQDVEGVPKDEQIYNDILALPGLISRVITVFEQSVRKSELSAQTASDEMHRYLERLLSKYEGGNTNWSGDFVKFYGQFMLVASVAVLMDNGHGQAADAILAEPFVLDEHGGMTAKSVSFGRIGSYLRSLEARNDRLKLRRLSLHGDLIKQVCDTAGFSFRNFVQADIALFIRSANSGDRWWPDSAVYVSDAHGVLPWYIRATSSKSRSSILSLLGLKTKADLAALIEKFNTRQIKNPEWSGAWSSVDVVQLTNLVAILESWKD
ncbi:MULTISPECIES: SEFIR domain-containing protein [unclassified Sphingomonas]|uniref:SEFIR domain-containing protein n=1 Tax=unclassified Sphingomonas TaxID=196159 RepID=UPI000E763737|nr:MULTISPECIES: SEFIR domain-containing protein [unclassified Sphingomonas]RKE53692.1 SEFIR domain-containing protein [Sphingomonas sp. PP-CC-1A-547]TCM10187.1 SEFIR domain-containing protein [Sphingomonas sp. PP-CC-3G-468]